MKHPTFHLIAGFLVALILAVAPLSCSSDDANETPTDGDTADGDLDNTETDGEDTTIAPHLETSGNFTIVYLRGTPYEMGKQQGEMLHDVLKEAVEFVNNDPLMKNIPTIAKSMGIIEMAEENSYQDLLDECQGLVDATEDVGFNMEFCLVLNFGDVMLEKVSGMLKRKSLDGPGCTEIVASGEATPDGRLYHARNLDWGSMDISIIHENPMIFVRQPTDGIPHVYVGFPMNLTPYTSMNMAGITACSNEADPVDESEQADVGRSHAQMLGQIIKSAHSLEEARAFVEGEEHMSSEIFVIADGNTKTAAVFEMTANHMHIQELQQGMAYAVNHFLSDEMKDYDLPQDMDDPDSSIMRMERLEQLINPTADDTLHGQLSLENLAKIMRDRVNPRTGVEAPFDEENIDNDAGIATNGPMHMVLFDPEKRLFWVAAGQVPIPQQPYQCFSLGEMLNMPDAHPCDPATY